MILDTPRGVVTIRAAQPSEANEFRALRLEALRDHPQAFSSDYAVNQRHPPEYWQQRLDELGEEGTIFFAVHAGGLIGMSGIQRGYSPKNRHSATIWGVYLQPAWRSAGIADSLIAACLEWARRNGVRIVRLAVATNNIAAIRCYARCGFTVYGVEHDSIETGGAAYDELLMERRV